MSRNSRSCRERSGAGCGASADGLPMNRARKRTYLQLLGAAATLFSVVCSSSPQAEPPAASQPPPQVTTTARTPVRLDSNHPPKIGDRYYPRESKILGEQGVCVVRLEVDADGDVRAEQLLVSSGFGRLDASCVAAFAGGHFLPATVDGKPVASWVNIPTFWTLGSHDRSYNKDFSAIPRIRDDYQLNVGTAYYPSVSREMHQQGDCVVRVAVDEGGNANETSIRKSTGFASLDHACVMAVRGAPFMPARKDGAAVSASTDFLISWKLPAH